GLSEFWLQVFVRENGGGLGLTRLSGPRQVGPDFTGTYAGRDGGIEVEWRWDDYLRHRHHLSRKYRDTIALVVMCADSPLIPLRPLLPRHIIYAPSKKFWAWHKTHGKAFANEVNDLRDGVFSETSLERSRGR